jgi:hypothetical protein
MIVTKLTEQELENLIPISNNVLVKILKKKGEPDIGYDAAKIIKTPDGEIKIDLDTTFNPEWMQTVRVELVKNPKSLYFNACLMDNTTMPWHTEVETMPGDLLYVEYITLSRSFGIGQTIADGTLFECGDDYYAFLPYYFILIAIRDGKIFPANGYVVGKEVKENIETTMIIPDQLKEKYEKYEFQVSHTGLPNKAYRGLTNKSIRVLDNGSTPEYEFNDDIEGKTVLLSHKNISMPLENNINPTLEKGLRVIQRRYITSVYE